MRNPTEAGLDRRSFLGRVAAGTLLTQVPWWKSVAGPFEGADFETLVPRDKRLNPTWIRQLTARGSPTVYTGPDLRRIGIPVGGIGCGQLYLGGDGRLWHWDIFNQPPPPDYGDYRGPHYARPLEPTGIIEQGFALEYQVAGHREMRRLDDTGFRDVRFRGEYPVARVDYRDPEAPIEVSLEAFSPFIPLQVDDSSLPLTVMEFTVHNPGRRTVEVGLAGWIQNAVCLGSGTAGRGSRTNTFGRTRDVTYLDCRAIAAPPEPATVTPRPDLVIDDFERSTYEPWTATGTAFGSGPVETEAMPDYQGKVGGHGRRVVNSHASAPANEVGARDAATGTLTSPQFVLERSYLNFLIGGGAHRGKTCVNLLVDGQVVLTATGENHNELRPRSWDVRPWSGRSARLQVVDAEPGPWGNIGLDQVVLSDTPRVVALELTAEEDYGSLALAMLGATRSDFGWTRVPAGDLPASVFPSDQGDLGLAVRAGAREQPGASAAFGERLIGALGRRWRLRPGRSATITFLVGWHFPAVRRQSLSHVTGMGGLRRAYANRFSSAAEVVRYGASQYERLAADTRLWRRTWYDESTLPHWFLERTFLNVSILATATCHHFDNGRFYGWEGTYCCAGTCQHVWQYAQAVGRVFPALERSVREWVDYGLAFHADTGAMDYRAEAHRVVAIDGQAGTILRTYREHRMSPDDAFLRRLWPRIRKSVEHLLARDLDQDGVLDGEQYNTLDASWYGEIAWLSSLYCAALRAGAAMAREAGDDAFADRCDAVADRGSDRMAERLFNGEYFIQRPDPDHPESINTNDGCHIDQVFGQSWAFQVGLPRVLPPEPTRRALESLWRYNFTPDVGIYRERFRILPGGRWYAMPGEGGLLMCTWPRGGSEKAAGKGDPTFVGYFNECMTGFEYQVAAHMVFEGLVQEGLAVARMIHDRYHASRRNPFNEVECSSHYARAMASHGVYLAACGFDYHGPRGELGFAPRWDAEDFRAAWIGAEGWGTFGHAIRGGEARATVEVAWGRLALNRLALPPRAAGAENPRVAQARLGGRSVPNQLAIEDGRPRIHFPGGVTVTAGQSLEIVLG